MKRLSAFLLTFALLFSLAACGPKTPSTDDSQPGGDTPPPQQPEVQDRVIDLAAVYDAILQQQPEDVEPLFFFPEANPDILENYYPGLSKINLRQMQLYMPPVTGFACEILLVEVDQAADVEAVKAILQGRIDLAGDETFYVETAALWTKRAQIHVDPVDSRYLCMIVLPEEYVIPENVFSLI